LIYAELTTALSSSCCHFPYAGWRLCRDRFL